MSIEQESQTGVLDVYIATSLTNFGRAYELTTIARAAGGIVRLSEPDLTSADNIRYERSHRDVMIARSQLVIMDLCNISFVVATDFKQAIAQNKEIILADLDPQSHAAAISEAISRGIQMRSVA